MPDEPSARAAASVEFIDAFCAPDIDVLGRLLVDDLRFDGPWLRCDSRDAYLSALRADPPQPARHEVVQLAETDDEVSVFYRYIKPGETMLVVQRNWFRGNRIARISLAFEREEPRPGKAGSP
jgi:hypothetical protein